MMVCGLTLNWLMVGKCYFSSRKTEMQSFKERAKVGCSVAAATRHTVFRNLILYFVVLEFVLCWMTLVLLCTVVYNTCAFVYIRPERLATAVVCSWWKVNDISYT